MEVSILKERLEILENEVGEKPVVAGVQLKSPEIGNKSDSQWICWNTHQPSLPPFRVVQA